MVSCGAPGCQWERKTDNRGLNRHRASCHLYKKVNSLASRRRQDRTKEAVISNLISNSSTSTSVSDSCFGFELPAQADPGLSQRISAIRHVRELPSLVPIAPCRLIRSISMARGLSCAQSESSLTDSQHPFDSEQQQINQNHDVEMGNSFGGMIESDHRDSGSCLLRRLPRSSFNFVFINHSRLLEEAVLPMGRIPGCLVDIEPSRDDLNHSNGADIPSNQTVSQIPAQTRIRRVLLTLRDTLQTTFNSFGLCRHYPRRPSFEPDQLISSSLLSRTAPTPGTDSDSPQVLAPPYPFPNMTIYRLLSWMNSGSNMVSESKVSQLVRDVLLAEEYDPKHLENFSVRRSLRELDMDESRKRVTFPDDWVQTDVTISIPTKSKDDGPQRYTIPGFHFRPLLEVIRAAFADAQARAFHLFPFQRLWKDPLDGHQERIYDEMYTSDAWLEAQDSIQRLPKEPGCSLERVIAGLMFFSDATHLANFGTAKAWPLYLYFGNLTKYARSSPQSGACHLVGFLPSVSLLKYIMPVCC